MTDATECPLICGLISPVLASPGGILRDVMDLDVARMGRAR